MKNPAALSYIQRTASQAQTLELAILGEAVYRLVVPTHFDSESEGEVGYPFDIVHNKTELGELL